MEFCNRVPFYGLNVLCLDHPNVQALLPHIEKRFVTYGSAHTADYRLEGVQLDGFTTRFRAFRRDEDLGEFTRADGGRAQRAQRAGGRSRWPRRWTSRSTRCARRWPSSAACSGASPCSGEARGVTVVDDYGHHPTEVKATLAGRAARVRPAHRGGVPAAPLHAHARSDAASSPPRSTTRTCSSLTSIYAAGEEPIPGRHAARRWRTRSAPHGHRDVTFVEKRADLPRRIAAAAAGGRHRASRWAPATSPRWGPSCSRCWAGAAKALECRGETRRRIGTGSRLARAGRGSLRRRASVKAGEPLAPARPACAWAAPPRRCVRPARRPTRCVRAAASWPRARACRSPCSAAAPTPWSATAACRASR